MPENHLSRRSTSNTYLAGEDPIEFLKRVSHRVVTMHASDRYLAEGTIEDGVDGIEQLQRSLDFLKRKVAQHWAV